ncbi:MAG TPA: hypothetical protein VM617_02770 [Thermoanaerobaculia bacterium]|nr:hypothetical protein [Thermoanaerobaculia bacterium]
MSAPGRTVGSAARRARWRTAALATGFGGLVVGIFYGALLAPSRVLLARDVALFHLPLRSDLLRLAERGLPSWNPWIHGGQPVLSNPGYSAFYPPTWLAAAVGPLASLDLLVLLHAGLALAGAWRLARHLGAGRGAAALAAGGFAAGGAFVSLTDALTLFFGAAWLPWILLAGERTMAADPGRWLRPAAGCGGLLTLLALNGEPATTLCGAVVLAALAGDHWLRQPPWRGSRTARLRPLRLLVPGLVAAALAAVQVVPTLARLADSPRAGGLDYATASEWSARPLRLVELFVAHPFGDPSRVAEGLFFGVGLHDRDVPYLATFYPGMAVVVLALAGLVAGVRRRGLWILLVAAGVALGLGRFDPLYPFLHAHLPGLGGVRFPEKFLLLVALALPFAAALAWQRLVGAAGDGERRLATVALVLAGVVAALTAAWWGVSLFAPEAIAGFVRQHAPPQLTDAGVARGVDFLAGRAVRATATAGALLGLLALVRGRRISTAVASSLALALLLADLFAAHGSLLRTVPAGELASPPPLARQLAGRPGRLFSDDAFAGGRTLVVAGEDPRLAQLRTQVATLDPASGNLWGFAYALDEDYDLMLTRWGRHGLAAARAARPVPEHFTAVLAAWDVGTAIHRRPVEVRAAELTAGRPSPPVRVETVSGRLPRFRGVGRVDFHPDPGAALGALARQGFEVARRDHWIGPPPAADRLEGLDAPRVVAVLDAGNRLAVDYQAAPAGGALVLAMTFDEGWAARVDGRRLTLHPTALGQIGVVVPGGRGRLNLAYRDPWLAPAAAVSGLALAGLFVLFLPRRRRGT